MTEARVESVVAVVLAHTAEVQTWHLTISKEEREDIKRTLRNLLDLGHVAGFSVDPSRDASVQDFVDDLRSRIGSLSVDACREAQEAPMDVPPASLMLVWGFDHAIEGAPASTGRLLGLELELIATPSADEELGAHLPGRVGRWLIHARPLGT